MLVVDGSFRFIPIVGILRERSFLFPPEPYSHYAVNDNINDNINVDINDHINDNINDHINDHINDNINDDIDDEH